MLWLALSIAGFGTEALLLGADALFSGFIGFVYVAKDGYIIEPNCLLFQRLCTNVSLEVDPSTAKARG